MHVLDILLWVGAGFWLLCLVQFILNTLLVPEISRLSLPMPADPPFVSIVVPARNEEEGIENGVTSFCRQDYPTFEVIVVDDCSTDATPRILADLCSRFPMLKVVRGTEPPEGWLGKPHAMEEGRREAKGDFVLFADADVVYAPDVLRRAMAYVLRRNAAMLFLMPKIVTKGFFEAVLMSTLCMGGGAVIPWFLVNITRSRFFGAGGGVFNLVRRDALEASGAFASLRDAVVDDIGLGFKVRRTGFPTAVAAAIPLVSIRQYPGAAATIEGYTKNIYPGLRRFPWLFPVPILFGAVVSLLPYYGFALALAGGGVSAPASLALLAMHAVLAAVALRFRQPWFIIFTNPLRELGWWWIYLRSFLRYHRKGVVWRGRTFSPRQGAEK
jgi:chlorobactene glucosyltransferase